jgi:uncharacterized membrane protein YcaP (DUF421 family)
MDIIIRALIVFVFVYLVLRALGKRELSEMTSFELVLLFVVGDLVQQSITQKDTSLTAAVLAISTIALLIAAQSYVVFRFQRTRPVLEGEPHVIVSNGQVLEQALQRERMTTDDLKVAARQQGIADLDDVRIAIVEADGKLSFIQSSGQSSPPNTDDRRAD